MKIIILHGDDTVSSYDRLQKFIQIARDRDWDIVKVSENDFTIPEALSSNSLFLKNKLVVLENSDLLNKSTSEWISREEGNIDATLVIYSQGTLNQKLIKSLPDGTKVEEFKIRSQIWNLLDSFFPGNAKNIILLLNEVVKKDPVEFVFMLLAGLMRDLYLVKTGPEVLKYPPWRLGKLKRQASRFSEGLLKEIISDLADADIRSKTSQAELKDSLDFIIASKLE